MNLKKIKFEEIIAVIENKPWIVFIFFGIIIFILFRSLFGSYFEADEWFHFTYYLPLTRQPDGFLTALVSTVINSGPLSGGQHVSPIATVILFLSTKFFGISFPPYAFMSLLLHSLNSFLIFLLIRTLLYKKENTAKIIYAVLGAIFFALSPTPIHTVTGAAAFYSYNVLSVTFFLLCVISFKAAFIKSEKKLIYASIIFLFLALLTKETAVFLFLLLPFMAAIEKRDLLAGRQVFSLKFLGKLFVFCVIIYTVFRFVIPNLNTLPGKIIDKFVEGYIPKSYTQPAKPVDTGTIVSTDLSFHKNLPGEVLSRASTFPIRMTGTLFLPRQTVFSVVSFITPIIVPLPDSSARLGFLHGAGNFVVIYLAAFSILIFCIKLILEFIRKRSFEDAKALITGLTIIILSAFPLVAIIFSFPRWGYDFYFDSRHYYNPNVGGALVFPFLLLGIARFVSKSLRIKKISLVALVLFIIWLVNNMYVFNLGIKQFTQNFQPDRREVVNRLKKYLPSLPQKIVFYVETDGLSAYGPILPFQTSVSQALTVVYYDKNPLPDSFFNKPLFDGKPQGYLYSEGRGFGYYTSKKKLSEDLLLGAFKSSDIYAFYYISLKGELLDQTSKIQGEMEDYLKETDVRDWNKFQDPSLKMAFLYPPSTKIDELKSIDSNIAKSLLLKDPQFNAEIFATIVPPAFNIHDNIQFLTKKDGSPLTFKDTIEKDVFFDKYHFNKATATAEDSPRYFMRFNDILLYIKTENSNLESTKLIERILGSLEIINEK